MSLELVRLTSWVFAPSAMLSVVTDMTHVTRVTGMCINVPCPIPKSLDGIICASCKRDMCVMSGDCDIMMIAQLAAPFSGASHATLHHPASFSPWCSDVLVAHLKHGRYVRYKSRWRL